MADAPSNPSGAGRSRAGAEARVVRHLSSGTIRHVIHAPADRIWGGDVPEIFLRLAGRGRIDWDGAPTKDRSGAPIFLPPGQSLVLSGKMRGLRASLPRLTATGPICPMDDALISVLCPRAWHAPEPIAEAAFALLRLLVEDELGKRAMMNGTETPRG